MSDDQEFLLEIQSSPSVEYGELADILVRQAQSADEVTRMTALRWLRAFVIQAKEQLMPYYAVILAAVLPNVSHNNQDICQVRLTSELCLLYLFSSLHKLAKTDIPHDRMIVCMRLLTYTCQGRPASCISTPSIYNTWSDG